ncbi:MAG: GntR family transcriptional regulator [Arachnia sp.]
MTTVAAEQLSRAEQVYMSLRADLMNGTIHPWDRLAEEPLAEEYSVSRTPVREALKRLEADGLVSRRQGGLFPYVPAFDRLADLYELRILLETQGISRHLHDSGSRHDPDTLGQELAQWVSYRQAPPEPDAGFVSRDESFHRQLLASSGNRAMLDALDSVNQRIRPVRMFDYLTHERMAATIVEHISIAEAVLAGELTAAIDQLTSHITESRDVVLERSRHLLPGPSR